MRKYTIQFDSGGNVDSKEFFAHDHTIKDGVLQLLVYGGGDTTFHVSAGFGFQRFEWRAFSFEPAEGNTNG